MAGVGSQTDGRETKNAWGSNLVPKDEGDRPSEGLF